MKEIFEMCKSFQIHDSFTNTISPPEAFMFYAVVFH